MWRKGIRERLLHSKNEFEKFYFRDHAYTRHLGVKDITDRIMMMMLIIITIYNYDINRAIVKVSYSSKSPSCIQFQNKLLEWGMNPSRSILTISWYNPQAFMCCLSAYLLNFRKIIVIIIIIIIILYCNR